MVNQLQADNKTIMRLLIRLVILLCLVISTKITSATHIVGGDITYRHIGGTSYRITLNLFVDCENGNPTAIQSDEFGIVGIFDASGTMVQKQEIRRNSPIRVEKLNYRCATNEPNQCVDHYVYTRVVSLPPSAGGYTLAFQRCCRNNSIKNLTDPGGTGATYWTHIPDVSVHGLNSSPVFDSISPNFLCTNAPFVFMHTATDPDGDSLVYELYRPYDGGDDDQSVPAGHPLSPRPDPPLGPPYSQILWLNPYGTTNMMAGNPILTMNRQTGEISVTPNTTGQFVVGFKVIEFRNGVKIGETLRDFQFNVLNCNFQVVADFGYSISCSNELKLDNKSYSRNANDPPSYSWHIEFPSESFNSTDEDLEFNNVAAGNLTIRLAATNTQCSDTFIRTINVPPILDLQLTPSDEICEGESKTFFAVTNVPTSKVWHNSTTGSTYTSNISEIISVEVTDNRGCTEVGFTGLVVKPMPVPNLGDGYNICKPFSDTLNAGNDGATYSWSSGQSSQEIVINQVAQYRVTINLDGCIIEDTITYTDTNRIIDIGPDSLYCEPIVLNVDAGAGFERYLWENNINKLTSGEQTYVIDTTGIYYVEVEDSLGCMGWDTLDVRIVPFYDFDLGDGENICREVFTRVVDAHRPKNIGAKYQWSTSSADTLSWIEITQPGIYVVTVKMDLCTKKDTIIYSDTNFAVKLGDPALICSDDTLITFDPGEYVSYLWQDGSTNRTYSTDTTTFVEVQVTDTVECLGFGEYELNIYGLPHTGFGGKDTVICIAEDLFIDAGKFVSYLWSDGSTDRFIFTRNQGPNWVTVTDTNGCVNTDTINISISKEARNTDLFIPNAFTPNDDGLNDEFPYDVPIEDRYDFNLKIFTRWGEKVFESDDPTKLWDGTVKDDWKYANTFIYIMQWRACDGKLELKKGIVMVLR